ncbi:MAG: 16S rRNA (guanine(966)-N(2))-methyltransferase RsmD [Deltaproteobacteria bacterium]|nr:16S rRNA (guanine(966)-N(2))-methyltransferase RsmD [Deltaproteobacteria bacterium]
MRVIGGCAKGRKLAPFPGQEIRPTSDRIREAVFNILFSRLGALAGKKVLDLFAGTGAMGLEALSRGASEAVFVEKNRHAAALIGENLSHCRLETSARIVQEEAHRALSGLAGNIFDLIFIDPPYGHDLVLPTLALIDQQKLLSPQGVICAEAGKMDEIPETTGSLARIKKNVYGSTAIHFFGQAQKSA